jgi:O-acetyl-ADP-ribose deacetylase (regulator of RNase III)
MAVIFIEGDLFNYDGLYSYAHGCNCKGAMGKGIALEFKKRFPEMYKEYKILCEKKEFKLGDVFMYNSFPYCIFNLATQESWTTKAKLSSIEESLSKMLILGEENNVKKIGLPRIGSGLGGLNWEDVKSIIIKVCRNSEIDIIVFESFLASTSVAKRIDEN